MPRAFTSRGLNDAFTRAGDAPLRQGNDVTLLLNGAEIYSHWLEAIGRAQLWIHFEHYVVRADHIGQRFASALAERAAAGVRVRVLYDWYGSLDVARSFWQDLRDAGVDVRMFNPLCLDTPLDVIHRDHRKLVAVDGVYASVGGVSIADSWLASSPISGLPHRDTAISLTGPAVVDLERAFARAWQRAGSALPPDELPDPAQIQHAGPMAARVIAQEPNRMQLLRALQLVLATAERRVWIADPYFIAVAILREALAAAARDGVDVRILVPAVNDWPLIAKLSRHGYPPLLEAGVQIWEYPGLMMHAKTTVADGWWARVGSTNLNLTGLQSNWELDVIVENDRFGATMETVYEADLAHSRRILAGGPRALRPWPDRSGDTAGEPAIGHRPERRVEPEASTWQGDAGTRPNRHASLEWRDRGIASRWGIGLLSMSLLFARFPRLIAWPCAAISGCLGCIALLRGIRRLRVGRGLPRSDVSGRFKPASQEETRSDE